MFEYGFESSIIAPFRLKGNTRSQKLCFLFSDVENNGEYAPPELLKVVRELGQQLLLDDLPGVKFLGSNKFTPAELKQNRKPLSLGDGYWYDARDGVQKLRLVKCEEAI